MRDYVLNYAINKLRKCYDVFLIVCRVEGRILNLDKRHQIQLLLFNILADSREKSFDDILELVFSTVYWVVIESIAFRWYSL